MTNQEIFNKVWNWFMVLGNPVSIGENEYGEPVCRYRGPNGEKCAAGVLIPDCQYSPDMENLIVRNIPYFQEKFPEQTNFLITDLQEAHDRVSLDYGENLLDTQSELKLNFIKVAEDYDLSIPD